MCRTTRTVWLGALAATTALALAAPVGAQSPAAEGASGEFECATSVATQRSYLEWHASRQSQVPMPGPLLVGDAAEETPLERLLGPDGYIETGTVVDMGGYFVLVDDGVSVVGDLLSGFSIDPVRLSRVFYNWMPDDRDMLTFLPNFSHTGSTFTLWVQNDVEGIGFQHTRPLGDEIFDETIPFGSLGRLQAVHLFRNFNIFPLDPSARIVGDNDSFLSLLAHEFAHRFGAYVRIPDSVAGNPDALLGRQGFHWCFFLDAESRFPVPGGSSTGRSSLEGNNWEQDLGNPRLFTSVDLTDGYSPLDLYLMGITPPEEVPPFFIVDNPIGPYNCSPLDGSQPDNAPVTIEGDRLEITVDDVIAEEGPRLPGSDTAQKDFTQGLVLVAREGRFPTPLETRRIGALAQSWEPYYVAATGGLSTVDTATGPVGPAVTFAFVRLPDSLQAGRGFKVTLLALDANARLASGYRGTVRFSASDPGATLPDEVTFGDAHLGYRKVPTPVVFASGGNHTLTATDVNDATITGFRSGLPVEAPGLSLCVPGDPDPTRRFSQPWGMGPTWASIGGVRFQYLLRADAIGRPGMITNLEWRISDLSGPQEAEWNDVNIRLGHKSDFHLDVSEGEASLDQNLLSATDVTQVITGTIVQRDLKDIPFLHLNLDEPFAYNGIDHLLVEIRYRGSWPVGLFTDSVFHRAVVISIERQGPNSPHYRTDDLSTVCLGARLPSTPPPTISNVSLVSLGNTTARLDWRTSPETDGRVLYGLAGGPLDQVSAAERFTLTHSVEVTGLLPGTDYEAAVQSQDIDAQVVTSEPILFRTTAFRPSIESLEPPTVAQGAQNVGILVTGRNLFPGVQVEVILPDLGSPPVVDPDIYVYTVNWLRADKVSFGVRVDPGAPPGPRRVRMINPDGFASISPVFLGIEPPPGATDVDASGRVDGFDLARLARAFTSVYPEPNYDVTVDLDGDGDIDGADHSRLAAAFGKLTP